MIGVQPIVDGISRSALFADALLPAVTDDQAMAFAGGWLAVEITRSLSADFSDVWSALTHLPDGYLRLLESPEGWAALGAIVAADLGVSSVPVVPAIH